MLEIVFARFSSCFDNDGASIIDEVKGWALPMIHFFSYSSYYCEAVEEQSLQSLSVDFALQTKLSQIFVSFFS